MGGIIMPYMGEMAQMGYAAPNTIPNLSLWYNASASATVVNSVSTNNFDVVPVVNTSSLGVWNDLSGGAKPANVNGGTGKQPTYAIPVQTGLGAVSFSSASSNNLDINPAVWSNNLTGFTIYVVARPTSLPVTAFPLTVSDTSLGMWWNGTNWSIGHSVGNRGTVSVTNDTSKFHIYGMIYDNAQTGNAGKLQFRYDKSSKTLAYTGTVGANTGTPAYWFFGGDNRGAVGGGNALSGTYMSGYLGEVLIWTRALSLTEISAAELYLNQKWGLGLT